MSDIMTANFVKYNTTRIPFFSKIKTALQVLATRPINETQICLWNKKGVVNKTKLQKREHKTMEIFVFHYPVIKDLLKNEMAYSCLKNYNSLST